MKPRRRSSPHAAVERKQAFRLDLGPAIVESDKQIMCVPRSAGGLLVCAVTRGRAPCGVPEYLAAGSLAEPITRVRAHGRERAHHAQPSPNLQFVGCGDTGRIGPYEALPVSVRLRGCPWWHGGDGLNKTNHQPG
jgi:hypothetical protein